MKKLIEGKYTILQFFIELKLQDEFLLTSKKIDKNQNYGIITTYNFIY